MRVTVERPGAVVDINALPYRSVDLDAARAADRLTGADGRPGRRSAGAAPVPGHLAGVGAQCLRAAAQHGVHRRQPDAAPAVPVLPRRVGQLQPAHAGHRLRGNRRAATATTPSSAPATSAWPPTRRTWRSPWSALDAVVVTRDAGRRPTHSRRRVLPAARHTPDQEHDLAPGELIVGHRGADRARAPRRSGYLKVRDRQSYEFALTSAAVALDVTGGDGARRARSPSGAWPPCRGGSPPSSGPCRPPARPELWRDAAARAADGAKPLSDNGFKVELVQRVVERQLATVAGLP